MRTLTITCEWCGRDAQTSGTPPDKWKMPPHPVTEVPEDVCPYCRDVREDAVTKATAAFADEYRRLKAEALRAAHCHLGHGTGTEEDGPDSSGCECTGTPAQLDCARRGCGFCRSVEDRGPVRRVRMSERSVERVVVAGEPSGMTPFRDVEVGNVVTFYCRSGAVRGPVEIKGWGHDEQRGRYLEYEVEPHGRPISDEAESS